jgi:hypothetical protein
MAAACVAECPGKSSITPAKSSAFTDQQLIANQTALRTPGVVYRSVTEEKRTYSETHFSPPA